MKITIPGTDVDIGFSLLCAAIFCILRVTFRHILYSFGWEVDATDTLFASSCMASVCHSTILLLGLVPTLLSQKYVPSEKLQPSPQWYKDATNSLMGFCTGYMVYDAVMTIVERWIPGIGPVFLDDDKMFIGHHILTILYMTSARWIKAGHISAMSLMTNGEASAPIMNCYLFIEKMLDQECCRHISWLPALFTIAEQIFSITYLICRVMVSPFVIGHITYDLVFTKHGRRDIPLWLSILWLPLCWGVQFGSIPWIMSCMEAVKNGPLLGNGEAGAEL